MNKNCFTLILTLAFVSALSLHPDYDAPGHYYRNINRHYYNNAHTTKDAVCLNAVAGVNTAIFQLLFDVKIQSNPWIIYSDLDAIDESSYYLTRTCRTRSLELVNQQEDEQTEIQSQACNQVMGIVGAILGPDGSHIFRHGYQRGMELSAVALIAGQEIGNGCDIVLRPAQQEDTQGGESANEEELSLGEAELYLEEVKMNFNMRILASESDDESEDDWESDNDSVNDKGDTDFEETDEDSDATGDSSGSFGWDSTKGFRIKISKSKDGSDDDYIISYDPKNGFSVKNSTSDDEDAEEASEEASTEEWNNEEWSSDVQRQDFWSLLAPFSSYEGQGNNDYDNNYNNNGNNNHHGGSRSFMF